MQKIFALYQLSRVMTIMDSFPALIALAVLASRLQMSWFVVAMIALNLWMLIFAYMINDTQDAEDDKHDPKKINRNPVSAGRISLMEANLATAFVAVSSVVALWFLGWPVFCVGLSILVFGFLYSWKPVRLKGRRVVDIISHGYFLAAAQVLFFCLLPGAKFDLLSVGVAVGVYLFSIGGDLFNEYRDWKADQKAGLHNTADLLGYRRTQVVTFGFWGSGLVLSAVSAVGIVLQLLPR